MHKNHVSEIEVEKIKPFFKNSDHQSTNATLILWTYKFVWSKLNLREREQTDRKVNTEGPKILSNDIFYIHTVIIACSIK